MRTLDRNRNVLLLALCLALMATVSPTMAGDECALSKAAKELASCECCHQFKQLLDSAEGADISLEVFELQKGLLVHLTGANSQAVEVIHKVVDELWSIGVTKSKRYCPDCQARDENLRKIDRDRALTDDGAMVVLTSSDEKVLEWLRKDTSQTQGLIASSLR